MIRRGLAHISPEELLLIPILIIVIAAVIAQPTAITRLFEPPYATPIPGDSPADVILDERTPAPAPAPTPSPASVELRESGSTVIYDRTGERIIRIYRSGEAVPVGTSGAFRVHFGSDAPSYEPVRRPWIATPLQGR